MVGGGVLLGEGALAVRAPVPVGAPTMRAGLSLLAATTLPLGVACGVRHGPSYVFGAALALPVVGLYAYASLVLPWTQLSFVLAQTLLEATLGVPVVGEPVASVLFGGVTLTRTTLRRAATVHRLALGVGGLTFLGLVVTNRRQVLELRRTIRRDR